MKGKEKMYPDLQNVNKKGILIELENYQLFLETQDDAISGNLDLLMERASKLMEIYSRTGKINTDFTYIYTKLLKKDILEIINESYGKYLSKEVQKLLANTYLAEEQYIMQWSDRVQRASIHQMDMIRTFISKEKEELKYLNYANQR